MVVVALSLPSMDKDSILVCAFTSCCYRVNSPATRSIDGNVFLRDHLHQAEKMIPSYNDTNTGVLFQTQKNSVVSNNIFGMDLRKMDVLEPVADAQLKKPLQDLKFIHECLGRDLTDEQGYLASGLQMYFSKDITIKENIMVCLPKHTIVCWLNTTSSRMQHSPIHMTLLKTMVSVS